MKIFLDTANLDAIRMYNDMGLVDGITTNPSLLAKEGGDPQKTKEEEGGGVEEVVSESYPVPIKRIGAQDKFGESARDSEISQLFEKHGITSINIANTVKEARGQKP